MSAVFAWLHAYLATVVDASTLELGGEVAKRRPRTSGGLIGACCCAVVVIAAVVVVIIVMRRRRPRQ
ncbi:hypothetical protein KZZ52_53635 [Dactylosporangium sp. AC04546]|uniref:hypothetical protein n=1 Tax=Dactylosporangium sp. AC04546 TaxID=2862460 RepID=UPI001EDF47BE|nr:hypothetical protein [Dactylosporangium sp. AC04546]WVK82699.1 hypothetical protein KZZ52_53635 [Dactylosporangium sp. AC04546]